MPVAQIAQRYALRVGNSEFPLNRPLAEPSPVNLPDAAEPSVLSPRIMIVDDDIAIVHFLRDSLELAGFTNIETYCNPAKALDDALRGECPAAVITDFAMPGMNGAELLQRIHACNPLLQGIIISADVLLARAADSGYPVLDKGKDLSEMVFRQLKGTSAREEGALKVKK
jgi:CheY-like chemotaxis protein